MTDSDTPPPVEAPAEAGAASAKPSRRLPRVVLGLALLVVLAGLGLFVWPRLAALLDPRPEGPTTVELARQVDALQGEVATLRQQVTDLEGRPRGPVAAAAPEAGLEQRLASLEAALARPGLPVHLTEDIKAQGDRLAAVEKNAADAATVLRLADRLDKAEATVRDLEARRSTAGARLLAVGQLRQAVDMAMPFDRELRTLKALAGQDTEVENALAVLRPRAAAGIPGRPALVARFLALEPAIVRAEALPEGDGWWRQTLNRLLSLVVIRREDGAAVGDGAAAVAARIDGRLAEGDLAAAVAEAARLTGGSAEVASSWLEDARSRLAADQALSELSAQAIAASAAGQ